MEWYNIQKKWHEMALRLQTVSPRKVSPKPVARTDEKAPKPPLSPAAETVDKSVMAIRAIA